MINKITILFVGVKDSIVSDSCHFESSSNIQTIGELKDFLVENTVDLIVYGPSVEFQKLGLKILKEYDIPAFAIGKLNKSNHHVLSHCLAEDLEREVVKFKNEIISYRNLRENKQYKKLFKTLTQFTVQVVHTAKDLFIAETKKYFTSVLKIKRCHWVTIKEEAVKLPPILKLKQELEKQKVDQSSLILELDQCQSEVFGSDEFQMWKTQKGHYLALLWIDGPDGVKQCLMLSGLATTDLIETRMLIATLMPFLMRRWSLCLTVEHANKEIYKDSLTNLYNQKFLNEVLEKKIEECRRYKTPFSVLFIDIDFFKKVNDSLGHVVGSGVLTQLGAVLQDLIRNSDYAFRYGGDEFIVLLGHTEGDDAFNVAERIRKKVENNQFNVNGNSVNITVSIGLAFYPKHASSAEEIVRIADEAMYYGKNKSRNIVYKAG